MAAQNPPYVLQGATGINHPAELFRRVLRTVSGGFTGIVNPGDLAVTANGTPNMSVNVAKGEALVAGTATVDQGTYYCFNDATVNLTVTAADVTNARIDLVVARVTDTLSDADTWSLAVIAGTPAPSPAVPAAPANSLILAQIAVAANATSIVAGNITDKRVVFGQRYHAEVHASAAQADTSSNYFVLTCDTVDADPNGNFNTTTHLYTCPVAGRYLVVGSAANANVTLGDRILQIYKNGAALSPTPIASGFTTTATGGNAYLNISAVVRCAAGDTLGVFVRTPGATANNIYQQQSAFEYRGPL